jgi:catechol 2,3-dioxygenase-like lactoylglutathione lyase family enzyme
MSHDAHSEETMINGAHVILYSKDAEADRAFLRDHLGLTHVDAGDGWLIFKLPPSEIAVHPTDSEPNYGFYFMCDSIDETLRELTAGGVQLSRPISEERWGRLAAIRLPGGSDLAVYEPRHPVAHALR